MEQLAGFPFTTIETDKNGAPKGEPSLESVADLIRAADLTDVIVLAHGFRNSEAEARSLYERFLESFRVHLQSGRFDELSARRIGAIGVFWPSKHHKEVPELVATAEGGAMSVDDGEVDATADAFAREELESFIEEQPDAADHVREATEALLANPDDIALQDAFVARVLDRVPQGNDDATEGIDAMRSRHGHDVIESLAMPIILPLSYTSAEGGTTAIDNARAGSDGDGSVLFIGSLFRSVRGRVGQVLNMGTWYTMKRRAGDVGALTVAPLVRELRSGANAPRVHLVGHSLGGRVMASAVASLDGDVRVQSLLLLQAAFSHYGFARQVPGRDGAGAFRSAVDSGAVTGPFTATFSSRDTVVGRVYAIASRLAGDNFKAIGDAGDAYGGIGRNGAQATTEANVILLEDADGGYEIAAGSILCVDGSAEGCIGDHSDVTNPKVTNLFAHAMAAT